MFCVVTMDLILVCITFSNNLSSVGSRLIDLKHVTEFFGLLGYGMSIIVESFPNIG